MKNLIDSEKFKEVEELVVIAKAEAKQLLAMYEVVEGFMDARIQMMRERIENEHSKTYVLKMVDEFYFMQTYYNKDNAIIEIAVDNCEFHEGVAKIKNKVFSKRTMVLGEEFVEITFYDKDNNFNDCVKILVKIEYSGNIPVTIFNYHQCILFP